MFKQISVLLVFCLLTLTGFATHLLTGNLSYRQLSSSATSVTYEVTLSMQRDCRGGISTTVQFGPEVNIGVYHNNLTKNKYTTVSLKLISKWLVNPSSCYNNIVGCIEAGLYQSIISLDKSTIGYYLVHESCCRTDLTNIQDNNAMPETGMTFLAFVPPTTIINSAPTYKYEPTTFNSINKSIEDDLGANDVDGDSLVFSMVTPYAGGNVSVSAWQPPSTMTLANVIYKSGYNSIYPFGSSGSISIDQARGILKISNNNTGNYAVCIEIKEFRNKTLIGLYRRDYPIIFMNVPPDTGYQVKLLKPEAKNNNSARISWLICPNISATHTVERKTKFSLWTKVGQPISHINFIDSINAKTWYYYRIRSIINKVEHISNIDSIFIQPVGANSPSSKSISLYPNPVKDFLFLETPSLKGWSIYDATGRLVKKANEPGKDSDTKIATHFLNPGLYFILLSTEDGLVSGRFIKE